MRPVWAAYQGGAVGTAQYTSAPRSKTAYMHTAPAGKRSRWRRSR